MKKILPIIDFHFVKCPVTGELNDIETDCNIGVENPNRCEYLMYLHHEHEKVTESDRDFCIACDIPKEELTVKMDFGE